MQMLLKSYRNLTKSSIAVITLTFSLVQARAGTPAKPPMKNAMAVSPITAVAPNIQLAALDGTSWRYDAAHPRAFVLVVIGATPDVGTEQGARTMVLTKLAESIAHWAHPKVEVRTVFPCEIVPKGPYIAAIQSQARALHLLVDDGALRKKFGINPNAVTIVAVDRAGIIRRIESHPFSPKIGATLQRIGDPTPDLKIGLPAPDFELRDAQGVTRRVSNLRGHHNLLLTFYPTGSSCGCGSHLPSLGGQIDFIESTDTEIWAVSPDSAESATGGLAFSKLLHESFPFLSDPGRNVALLYNAVAQADEYPDAMTVLIDKDGIVRDIEHNFDKLSGTAMKDEIIELGWKPD
jgi:peroxiredoxin